MKLTLNDAKIFKDCFKSIGRIIDEAIIECDGEGLRLRALDRSHISFVELELKAGIFDEYTCEIPEKISVDTMELNNVLKRCKNSDVLTLETNEGLTIKLEGESIRTFKLRLISLDYETPTPPDLNLPIELDVPCDFIREALTDIDLYSEKIRFSVDENYLILSGGGEYGDVTDKFIHGVKIEEVVVSVFNIEKIKDMVKDIKFNKYCNISVGDDKPLLLKIYLNEDNHVNGFIKFMLAPRLENEE